MRPNTTLGRAQGAARRRRSGISRLSDTHGGDIATHNCRRSPFYRVAALDACKTLSRGRHLWRNALLRVASTRSLVCRKIFAWILMTVIAPSRLIIADDHPLFRGALRQAVSSVLPTTAVD